MNGIETLNLSSNQIRDTGTFHISRMKGIKNLNLQSNEIRNGVNLVSHMPKLTSENLDSNGIGDDDATILAQIQEITNLNLRSNQIGNTRAQHLSSMMGLTSLNLSSNHIRHAGASAPFESAGSYDLGSQF